MTRATWILGAVGLLFLAGCSGPLLDGRGPTSESPPGVENGTLTNESALIDAHRGAVLAEGFVFRMNDSYQHQTGRNETLQYRIRSEPDMQQYQVSDLENNITPTKWGNGTNHWMYTGGDSTPHYRFYDFTPPLVEQLGILHRTGLNASDDTESFTVTDTFQRDGRHLTVLEANRTNRPAAASRDTHVRMVVDADGVVWEQRVVTRTRRNNTTVLTRTMTSDLTQLGSVTVDDPAWLDEAVRHCAAPNASWSRC